MCEISSYSRLFLVRPRLSLLQRYGILYCIITSREERRGQGKGSSLSFRSIVKTALHFRIYFLHINIKKTQQDLNDLNDIVWLNANILYISAILQNSSSQKFQFIQMKISVGNSLDFSTSGTC